MLAALPLLSGCVEGELEPGYEEALVDALVEEVGTGLWAGEGNPLADFREDYDFRCGGTGSYDGDKQDCRAECWMRGGGGHRDCDCYVRLDGSERGYRKFRPAEGGGEHEPRPPPRPRPPGLIGGGGDDDEEEEHGGLSLECDKGKTRGTSAGCRVEVGRGRSLDSMTFQWQVVPGGKVHEGRGESYSSWDGTATEDRKFWLEIVEGRRMWMLTDSVTVGPRSWSLQERSADMQWVDSIPDHPKAWGYYGGGLPVRRHRGRGMGADARRQALRRRRIPGPLPRRSSGACRGLAPALPVACARARTTVSGRFWPDPRPMETGTAL